MASVAVNAVDNESTDAEVSAAENAITRAKGAIADADNVPADEKAANTVAVNNLATQLSGAKTARTTAMEQIATDKAMAAAKTGKDLYAALEGAAAGTNALANVTESALVTAGLDLTVADDAGTLTGAVTVPTLIKADDSAGALGSWSGTHYAHTNAETKVENAAVVYNNKGPGRSFSFADLGAGYQIITTDGDDKGYVSLVSTGTVATGVMLTRVMATDFNHSGTQNHPIPDRSDAFYTRGTYDGAAGEFRCTGTGTCSSTNDGKGGPSALGGTWHFKPDAGASAMAHRPDAHYLFYGWWVSKDKDGVPTAASVFTDVVGTIAALANDPVSVVTGSAIYAGHAAGKFALDYSQHKVLDGASDGGHFTADVLLTAKFGTNVAPNSGGVSGTVDGFRLNDGTEDPGWSVSLHRAPWGTGGAFATPANDVATTMADERLGTTWSIDRTAADRSGSWSGQMYDELPGNTDDSPSGDGSDIPTTVTGTFYTAYGTAGRMVGAFGANHRPDEQ